MKKHKESGTISMKSESGKWVVVKKLKERENMFFEMDKLIEQVKNN